MILAVFLSKDELIKIFGKNLLDDAEQETGYRELCGLNNFKPFECVGEIEESVYAILNVNESFKNDFVVKNLEVDLKSRYNKTDLQKIEKELFTLEKGKNLLGEKFGRYLEKFLN